MATLTITKIHCSRKQDVTGDDEPVIDIGGRRRWTGKMGKGDTRFPNEVEQFSNSILVELKERDGNNPKKDKSLGKWTVYATPTGNKTLTATSSGYLYEVTANVQ